MNLPSLARMRISIAPSQIHFLKFILEAYDGMAILSTVDRHAGLVELKYPVELEPDIEGLLLSMGERLCLTRTLNT